MRFQPPALSFSHAHVRVEAEAGKASKTVFLNVGLVRRGWEGEAVTMSKWEINGSRPSFATASRFTTRPLVASELEGATIVTGAER
jgi:hypothetical protein